MILRFGVFELDETSGELRRAGVRIRVQDQPLRVLGELLGRRGEIVTREELRAAIWGETFVDYEHALNTAIRKLRDALSDSAEAPRYIETIARKGYRFVAPVERLDVPVEMPVPEEPPPPARAGLNVRPAGGLFAIATLVGLFVLATVGYFLYAQRTPGFRSVAVLPFANLTGSATHEYVADGVTEALISDLARMPALRVISRTSVMQYKQARKPLPKIASELAVEGVIEGAVLRFGEQVRVEVKLIDAREDTLLWSGQYERPAAELDTLQRDVAAAVAAQLRTRQGKVQAARAPDAEAHLLTMRARYWLNEKRDRDVAVQLLQQAIAKDPTYAAPHAVLAEAETFLPEADVSPYESLVRAKAAAENAVALDPSSADAHAALGTVLMFLDRDFAAAERAYLRAIELKPGASETHHRYGQFLAAQGRFDEALAEGKRSIELDPFSTLAIDDYGRTLYFARRFDEALAQYERALAIEPDDTIAFWFRIYALIAAKQNDRVIEELAKLMERSGRSWYVPQLRELYARGGIDAVIREWAALDAQQARDARFIRSSGVATRYAQAGETELAMQWLERSYASHTRDLVYLKVEPQFDNVRKDPRFQEVVERVFGAAR